jgi:heme-degrading monooxygenase HmoA
MRHRREINVISRYWRGLFRAERAEDYVQHLREHTFPILEGLNGFLGGSILRRDLATGVEFVVLTRWQSLESIKVFAGDDPEHAVVPDELGAMIIECDERVRHYEEVSAR